jgi:hypothetical protein
MKLGIASIIFGLLCFAVGDDGALYGGAHVVGGVSAIAWGVFVMLNWGEE